LDIVVLLKEEFGYRHWVWMPKMSAEELKSWWQSLPSVAVYFYDGPSKFPGDIFQVYYEPEWRRESDNDTHLEEGEFIFVEQNGCNLTPLSSTMQLPEDCWHAHMHIECDSYLKSPDGEVIHHAGYITEDEYYNEDYQAAPEVEEAWTQATMNQLKKILKEEADGDSSNDRIVEEPN
jgi:hypothetical protein